MSSEENKAIVGRFYTEVNDQGKVDVLDAIAADDVLIHEPTAPGGILQGRDAL